MTIKNLTMGLATDTSITYGLIGIGYASNEASIETAQTIYPNLPVAMMEDGLINTIAYSLWLNDLGSSSGSILFGGIDTAKFVGNLTRIDIQLDQGEKNFTEFAVTLTSLEATSSSGTDILTSDKLPLDAVLDAGTTLSYLPQDLSDKVWEEVGAEYDAESALALVPCSYSSHSGHFTFGLAGSDGPRINVTMDELVFDLSEGGPSKFSSGPHKGKQSCVFGIQNQTSAPPYLLGDTFLRSAYVVYDLVNNQIGIAATDFNSTESNVVPFASSGAPIPSATAAPDQNETASAPTTTQTGMSASDGFQAGGSNSADDDDNGAALLASPGLSITAAGLAMLLVLR